MHHLLPFQETNDIPSHFYGKVRISLQYKRGGSFISPQPSGVLPPLSSLSSYLVLLVQTTQVSGEFHLAQHCAICVMELTQYVILITSPGFQTVSCRCHEYFILHIMSMHPLGAISPPNAHHWMHYMEMCILETSLVRQSFSLIKPFTISSACCTHEPPWPLLFQENLQRANQDRKKILL